MQKTVKYEAKRTKGTAFESQCNAPFVVLAVTETTSTKNGRPRCTSRSQPFAYTTTMLNAKNLAFIMNTEDLVQLYDSPAPPTADGHTRFLADSLRIEPAPLATADPVLAESLRDAMLGPVDVERERADNIRFAQSVIEKLVSTGQALPQHVIGVNAMAIGDTNIGCGGGSYPAANDAGGDVDIDVPLF